MTVEARVRKEEILHNQRAWMTWHIAALMRQKKMPRLETFMIRKRERSMTPKQMKEVIMMHHVLNKGTYKSRKK